MDSNLFRILGRSGLKVARIGVTCSYGAPAAAFEETFDQGINYFYWGSRRTDLLNAKKCRPASGP